MEIAHSGNLYDNVRIDIQKAHRDFVRNDNGAFRKRSRLVTGVLLKTGFWKRLVEAGFIRDWFDEFCR